MDRPKRVFISYAHEDESHRESLEGVLRTLEKEHLVTVWHDRKLTAAEDWRGKIDTELRRADLILLLVSPSFADSPYIRDVEMRLAVDRHESGLAEIVPIIAEDIDLASFPFNKYQAVPKDGKAVTAWSDPSEAWADVAARIRSLIAQPPRPHEELLAYLQRHISLIALTVLGWAFAFLLTGLEPLAEDGVVGGWRWALVGMFGAVVMGQGIRRYSRAVDWKTVGLLVVAFSVGLFGFWPVFEISRNFSAATTGHQQASPFQGMPSGKTPHFQPGETHPTPSPGDIPAKGVIDQLFTDAPIFAKRYVWAGLGLWGLAGLLGATVLWSHYRTRSLLGEHSRPRAALVLMASVWGVSWLMLGLIAPAIKVGDFNAKNLIAGLIVGAIGTAGTYIALWTLERPVLPRQG